MVSKGAVNMAVGEHNVGRVYRKRADRALAADDLDRCMVNLELALPHCREAARICRCLNLRDKAAEAAHFVALTEGRIRLIERAKAAHRG